MKRGKDLAAHFAGLTLIHQNLPGKTEKDLVYPEPILFLPLHGEIQIHCEQKNHSLGPGRMFYLPGGKRHDFASSLQAGERLIAMIESKRANALAKTSPKPQLLPCHHLSKEILFYLLLNPLTRQAGALVQVFFETLAELLAQAQSEATTKNLDHLESKISDPRLLKAFELMTKSLAEPLTVTDLARAAGLSTRNFQRLLFNETGLQPKQWVIRLRVERATELLREPGASVTQVALDVGYSSLGSFISAFRARTGRLPSDFLSG